MKTHLDKHIEFSFRDRRQQAHISVQNPCGVAIFIAVRLPTPDGLTAVHSGVGMSSCAPEDYFDIRVGVPLALRRALNQVKGVNRPAFTREFFRQWKEAHPSYKYPYVHS